MSMKFLQRPLDEINWDTIFSILSMDLIDPYVSEMGLTVTGSSVEAIKQASRSFFEQYYQLQDQFIGMSPDKYATYTENVEVLIGQAYTRISQTTDEQTAQKFYHWVMDFIPFGGPDDVDERRWGSLLRRLAGLYRGEPLTPPSDIHPEKINDIIHAVQQELGDYFILSEEIDNLEKKPKTEWEKRVYQTYEPDTSPLDLVLNVIEFHRFQKTWRRIESILSNSEKDVLLQWGKEHVGDLGVDPESLKLPVLKSEV